MKSLLFPQSCDCCVTYHCLLDSPPLPCLHHISGLQAVGGEVVLPSGESGPGPQQVDRPSAGGGVGVRGGERDAPHCGIRGRLMDQYLMGNVGTGNEAPGRKVVMRSCPFGELMDESMMHARLLLCNACYRIGAMKAAGSDRGQRKT